MAAQILANAMAGWNAGGEQDDVDGHVVIGDEDPADEYLDGIEPEPTGWSEGSVRRPPQAAPDEAKEKAFPSRVNERLGTRDLLYDTQMARRGGSGAAR